MATEVVENGTKCSSVRQNNGEVPEWGSDMQQEDPSCHGTVARRCRAKWSREMNVAAMECYFQSRRMGDDGKPIRGYRKRMIALWKERGYDASEQRLSDQVRAIEKNGWLSAVELEMIKQRVIEGGCRDGVESGGVDGESCSRDISIDVTGDIGLQDEVDAVHGLGIYFEGVISERLKGLRSEIMEVFDQITKEAKRFYYDFKTVDRRRLEACVKNVNEVLKSIGSSNITATNGLIKAGSVVIARQLGLRNLAECGGNWQKRREPWWKRRIENDIKLLRRSISILDQKMRGKLRRIWKFKELEKKYRIRKKGVRVVFEELKQRLVAKKTKIKRYEQRYQQYVQNRMFRVDQKKFYQSLRGVSNKEKVVPDSGGSVRFWNGIWGQEVQHNKEVSWLDGVRKRFSHTKQEDLVIVVDQIRRRCRKLPNWKTPGLDGVQGYWIKHFSSCHQRIAKQFNELLMGEEEVPEWITCGKTVLCQKDPRKGVAVDNFRPISCLPVMWKLLTSVFADSLYEFLECNDVLPVEQKGCRRGSKGTKDQLLIDKMVLRDSKKRHTNLAMAWIDYKKAYDMVPHSWIVECLDMVGCADNVRSFIERSMKLWKCELYAGDTVLGDISISRGIFQGDSLSPLLFVVCLIPLTMVLHEVKAGYELKGKGRINHLLYMDDLKLYGKTKEQVESLVNTVQLISKDIGMEFGVAKCGMLVMKRGKVIECEGIMLPGGEVVKVIEDEGYRYLGVLEKDDIMVMRMKEKVMGEYYKRLRLILKSKLNGRNKIMGINMWAVAVVRYGGGIIDWRQDELQKMDRKTRKMMTMHGALHPKSDVNRLYLSRKRGGRGLIGCEACVRSEINDLGWYLRNSEEVLLKEVRKSKIIDVESSKEKKEYKKEMVMQLEDKWRGKVMYGQYYREMADVANFEKSWLWLQRSDLKCETEALICAAQEQALRTNYIKCRIDKSVESQLCRLCKEKGESIHHVVSECKKLAQREYKQRHDSVARFLHWELCGKYGMQRVEKWYEHQPEGVMESDEVKLLWDFMIQCDHMIVHRKPDIVVLEKGSRKCLIIDVAIPGDTRIASKEEEKIEKYKALSQDISKMWELRKVEVVPIVVGALGAVTENIEKWIKKLGITVRLEHLQKTALLGTARIIRRHLNTEN